MLKVVLKEKDGSFVAYVDLPKEILPKRPEVVVYDERFFILEVSGEYIEREGVVIIQNIQSSQEFITKHKTPPNRAA